MREFVAPEWTKKLSRKGRFLGRGWVVHENDAQLDYSTDRVVHWVATPLVGLLVLGFGYLIFNADTLFGLEGMRIPAWAPGLFYGLIILVVVAALGVQFFLRAGNKPWLSIDNHARRVTHFESRVRQIEFDDIKRVHMASAIVHFHAEGQTDRRHYEVSLLVLEEGAPKVERVALIETVERSVALKLMDSIKNAIGHRGANEEGDFKSATS